MKTLFSAIAMLALLAPFAHAGGPVVLAAEPVVTAPAPAADYDWTGPYLGIGYGTTSTSVVYAVARPFDFTDGLVESVHVGFMVQSGVLVYGTELSYGSVHGAAIVGFPNDRMRRVVDLKSRLGWAMDRFQLYGIIGYSQATHRDPSSEFEVDGLAYGIGAEFGLLRHASVGIEYMARDLSGFGTTNTATRGEFDLDTLSLRVNFRF